MGNINWKEYFIGIADSVRLKSKDPSTQIGAVIVGEDNEIVSTGYNSFPRGLVDDRPERFERPEKYKWFEHAERNSIFNAARIGVSTKNTTIYLTCGLPCTDCSRAIINSGITKIVCKRGKTKSHGLKGKHWEENIMTSEIMLNEAGIDVEYYD